MLVFNLTDNCGNNLGISVPNLRAENPIKSQLMTEWYEAVITEIYDDESGYEFYDTLTIEEAEEFIYKFSEMDLWEKVIFIGYYDQVYGSIMVALKEYISFDLYLVKNDYRAKIY